MTKQQLRHLYKQKRLDLSPSQQLKLDDLLLIQFQRLALPEKMQTLLSYWPIEKFREVNTYLYTRYLQFAIPNLQLAYPVVDGDGMKAVLTDDDTEFVENMYGIPEPVEHETNVLLPKDIDLIFVPLLAFDNNGFRVGYGKGYYDRFFPQCRANICKVGFSYFHPVDKIDDTHHYDVSLNYCITPERIYEF